MDFNVEVVLRSFAGKVMNSSVTASEENGGLIATWDSRGSWWLDVANVLSARVVRVTASGKDTLGPLFDRVVRLQFDAGQVQELPPPSGKDPPLPTSCQSTVGPTGITVKLELTLPRLRERVPEGLTPLEEPRGLFVAPTSVSSPPPHSWNLRSTVPSKKKVRKILLEAPPGSVPPWYAVAFPETLTNLRDLLLFFAPQPAMKDAGAWAKVAYPDGYGWHVQQYMGEALGSARLGNKRLGFQLVQSGANIVLVYPLIKFFTHDLGALAKGAKPVLDELSHYLMTRFGGAAAPITLGTFDRLAACSFSYGAENLTLFLTGIAGNVRSSVREIYDFDSEYLLEKSVAGNLIAAAQGFKGVTLRRYTQQKVAFGSSAWRATIASNVFPLAAERWADLGIADLSLHHDIVNHMLTHALAFSQFVPKP